MMTHAGIMLASFLMTADADAASAPMPQEIAQELDYFVGDWGLEGEGARGPMKSSWSMRWAPGKHCLIVEYRRQEPGKVILGNALWGWDSASGEIVYHAQYSDRGLEHIRTKIAEADLLKGTYMGSLDGKHSAGTCVLRKEGRNQWTFKTNGVADSGLGELDVRFTRITPDRKAHEIKADKQVQVPKQVWKALDFFVGTWEVTAQAGEEESGKATWVFEWAEGKPCLRCTQTWTDERGTDSGAGIFGYDVAHGQLVYVQFYVSGASATMRYDVDPTNVAETPAWAGTMTAVDDQGEAEKATISIERQDGQFIWRSTDGKARDGQALPDAELLFKRTSDE
jgi:hypothetical protein